MARIVLTSGDERRFNEPPGGLRSGGATLEHPGHDGQPNEAAVRPARQRAIAAPRPAGGTRVRSRKLASEFAGHARIEAYRITSLATPPTDRFAARFFAKTPSWNSGSASASTLPYSWPPE